MTLRSLPNLLTGSRLLAAPVAWWLIGEEMMAAAFWLFFAAAVTDALDGLLAKVLNAKTVLGSFLDPLADKALLLSVYVSLGLLGELPRWLVILVVSRDIAIVGGAVLYELLIGKLVMRPLTISKANTLAQAVLVGVVLARQGLGIAVDPIADAMVWLVAATSAVSGLAYLAIWGRAAAGSQEG